MLMGPEGHNTPSIKVNIPGLVPKVLPNGQVSYESETPPPLPDETLEGFPKNGEVKQLGSEKSESRVSRVLGALKNVGTKDFWFKERQLISDNENDGKAMKIGKDMLRAGGVLGKTAFNVAGSVTGAKLAFDLPLWALQTNEVRKNKNEMKAFLKGKNSFAEKQSKIREMLDKASMAKKLTPKELEDFQAALAKVSESEGFDHGEKYDALVDNYLRAKTSGMEVIRQTVNTAFMATGMQLVRGVATLSLKGLETLAEAKSESVRSEFSGEKESVGAIFKKKFVDSARNTLSLGMSSEKKDRTGLQKFADTAKALGTIGTFLGLGSAALSELNSGSVSEHIGSAMDKLGEKGFDQVGANVVANSMKMWNLYSHPIDALQNAKKGVGAAIGRFFGEGSQKESLGGLQDGVNYQSDATRMDMDGRQLPQEASFGRATSILQGGESRSEDGMTLAELKAPARGIMEGYDNPQSVVEMSPAELAARSAAGTIASLPGEAQNFVRGAARGAYDAMGDLAGPPMSKMPLEGQLGMSPHDLDGHQIPEDASFGRAAVAGSAARGIMEGYDSKSYVEATPVEQAAMAAGAKFGELHGKAQGLAGSAAQKAYESISELAKPPMSEMATGPSGMSYRNHTEELAAKAAENIVGANTKVSKAFDSVRNTLGKGFGEMIAQGNESRSEDGMTLAELKAPARGIMEGYDSKSYVEATPVEQAAMAAGAKFGELHGKAQGLAGSAAQKAYESISELAKPPMSEMATGPSGMSYRNHTEELAAKAAENIVGAHNKAFNAAGEARDRAAEFLGLKPKDQEFTFDETVVTADRPRMGVHHPQYDSVRNQLRGGVPKGMGNDEKSGVDDFLKSSRESQDRLRAAMAKPPEPIGAKQASLSEGGVKERVSAEVARATAKIDEALATPVKPIGLGKALAEAQRGVPSTTEGQTNEDSSKELVDAYRKSQKRLTEAMAQPQERIGGTRGSSAAQELASKGEDSDARKAVKAAWKKAGGDKIDEVINTPNRSTVLQRALVAGQEKADAAALAQTQEEAPRVISSNGKSALRMKLDAIDKAGRELSGPDSEDRLRATKEVAEMKRILGSAKNSNLDSETPFERAAASEKKMLVNDLSKLGLSLKNDESLIFQPTKEIQKQLVNSGVDYGLARQAYQIGALEHEAAALPVGSARDRVLSLKRSLQESLDNMLKESASGSEKSTVKKLISAIAKDPRKF